MIALEIEYTADKLHTAELYRLAGLQRCRFIRSDFDAEYYTSCIYFDTEIALEEYRSQIIGFPYVLRILRKESTT